MPEYVDKHSLKDGDSTLVQEILKKYPNLNDEQCVMDALKNFIIQPNEIYADLTGRNAIQDLLDFDDYKPFIDNLVHLIRYTFSIGKESKTAVHIL